MKATKQHWQKLSPLCINYKLLHFMLNNCILYGNKVYAIVKMILIKPLLIGFTQITLDNLLHIDNTQLSRLWPGLYPWQWYWPPGRCTPLARSPSMSSCSATICNIWPSGEPDRGHVLYLVLQYMGECHVSLVNKQLGDSFQITLYKQPGIWFLQVLRMLAKAAGIGRLWFILASKARFGRLW